MRNPKTWRNFGPTAGHQTGEGFNGNYWQYGQFWRLVCWVSSPKKNMTRRKPESRGSTWKAKPHCSIYHSNHYAAMPDFYPTARKRRYNMRQPACIHIHLIIQYKFVEKRERERDNAFWFRSLRSSVFEGIYSRTCAANRPKMGG